MSLRSARSKVKWKDGELDWLGGDCATREAKWAENTVKEL